ncbi:MAG TPA: hydrogenase 4 subunit F [Azospirillum sp.]|nr:hydrogenase 4 subunit F [Azospirillum sp.]
MSPIYGIVALPLLSGAMLALIPGYRLGAWLNVASSGATLLLSLLLFTSEPGADALFVVDAFNIYLIVLTAFVGFTTSIFSATYIGHEIEVGKLRPLNLRFYHAMYQAFMFTMLLALSANNLGMMWVAVEGATLTTVLMVSLYRTAESIEAAWKYFILCGVGIALALFGTILMYLAAQPVMGPGMAAMTWTELIQHVAKVDASILNLAFVFLLIGYGTKVGLAPLHAWLPDAHAEGPTPISAVLSGLLLNVALYAVLRFKMLLAANGEALSPGPLMISMGLGSLALAGLMLYRRRDIKRFFAYSSIEHMGIITFAFGMGGPLANFAGLLHMAMHSLTKSAIFYAVGHVAQARGTQAIDKIRGLTVSHPALGWGLLLGVVAIAGLPPFGIFMSEFLLITTTFAREPLLALPLVLGVLVAFGALVLRVQQLCFGEADGEATPIHGSLVPLYAHLGLVLVAGIWLPGPLVAWFQTVAHLLG